MHEQVELASGQGDELAVDASFVGDGVHLEASGAQRGRLLGGQGTRRPPKHRLDAGSQLAHRAYDAGTQGAHRLYHAATHPLDTAKGLYHAAASAAGRVKHGIGDVVHGVGHAASWAMHKAGETVGGVAHKGLEWLHKTGVAGAIGKGLKYGVSMIKTAAKYSPIGLAMQGIHKAGGLKGGLGSGSTVTENGLQVGALVAVNAWGSVVMPGSSAGGAA